MHKRELVAEMVKEAKSALGEWLQLDKEWWNWLTGHYRKGWIQGQEDCIGQNQNSHRSKKDHRFHQNR